MLFADGTAVSESASSWVNDTTYLLDTGVPWTYENGWVFLAWQAVCDGSGNLTLRQWVRYAGQAVQGPYTTAVLKLPYLILAYAGIALLGLACVYYLLTPVRVALARLLDCLRGASAAAGEATNDAAEKARVAYRRIKVLQ
jgi:hypothetical protein